MRQDKKSASIKFKHDIQKKITHLKTNPYDLLQIPPQR